MARASRDRGTPSRSFFASDRLELELVLVLDPIVEFLLKSSRALAREGAPGSWLLAPLRGGAQKQKRRSLS
jgi:hypothetical protein